MKFGPHGPIKNIPALVQIMAWCQSGDKPLSEPMMFSLLIHASRVLNKMPLRDLNGIVLSDLQSNFIDG